MLLSGSDTVQGAIGIKHQIHHYVQQQLASKFHVSFMNVEILTPHKILNEICNNPLLFSNNDINIISQQHTIVAKCGKKTHFIRFTLEVRGYFLIAAKTLPAGHTIEPGDLKKSEGVLNSLPHGILLDAKEIIGMATIKKIQLGQVITPQKIKPKKIITRGKEINLKIVGQGFTILTRAKAVRHAALGETFLIRTQSGKLLSAIATSADDATIALNI